MNSSMGFFVFGNALTFQFLSVLIKSMKKEELIFPHSKQLEILKGDRRYANIISAAVKNNGIQIIDESERQLLISQYDEFSGSVTKFVPASGAASRMFKHIHHLNDKNGSLTGEFLANIQLLPFYKELNNCCKEKYNCEVLDLIDNEQLNELSALILEEIGLNFGQFPKGLIPFHLYEDEVRNPFQEQIIEGIKYATKNGKLSIHFTVSPSHEAMIKSQLETYTSEVTSLNVELSFSIQREETNTIALSKSGEEVLMESGEVLLRPGGHGALLYNLNEVDSDLIFIKNIDNVVTEKALVEQSSWKKAIAGRLLEIRTEVFKYHSQLVQENANREEIMGFLKETFGYDLTNPTQDQLIDLIDRPLRVCGMVLNEGQPGGGPYYVKIGELTSLQIVESAEIDKHNEDHLRTLRNSTHFNPVDIVCSVNNFRGEKYDLTQFVNPDACFTSHKDYNGQEIKILELPGLWNGAMAKWNTAFVEVPVTTFNPVKTVNDLLKNSHRV